jgi:hypothetical protein
MAIPESLVALSGIAIAAMYKNRMQKSRQMMTFLYIGSICSL